MLRGALIAATCLQATPLRHGYCHIAMPHAHYRHMLLPCAIACQRAACQMLLCYAAADYVARRFLFFAYAMLPRAMPCCHIAYGRHD